MTQLQQVDRRTTVATSAIVAAAVSIAITLSGLLIVPAIVAGPAVPNQDVAREARLDRAVAAGNAWQIQRNAESPAYYERMHRAEQAGLAWQAQYELTNLDGRSYARMVEAGREWQVRHEQMKGGSQP